MLGTRAFAELVTRIDAARGKLVVVGDTNQLPSIEAGGVLGALATRLPAIALRRQPPPGTALGAPSRRATSVMATPTERLSSTSATAGSTSGGTPTKSSIDCSPTGTPPTTPTAA